MMTTLEIADEEIEEGGLRVKVAYPRIFEGRYV
jgi:hypothetical protein